MATIHDKSEHKGNYSNVLNGIRNNCRKRSPTGMQVVKTVPSTAFMRNDIVLQYNVKCLIGDLVVLTFNINYFASASFVSIFVILSAHQGIFMLFRVVFLSF